jgi:uncharacterized damage-inducible protein DinB
VLPLIALLDQLAEVVARLPDSHYAQKPVGVVESSVGGHVRHCLDHVRALIDAVENGELNYDDRRRGTAVEASPRVAREATDELIAQLRTIGDEDLDRPIHLVALLGPDEPAVHVRSSVGRELVYVVAHTVHHNALIAAMVKTLGGWLPARFGYAPSTLKHLENNPCAR